MHKQANWDMIISGETMQSSDATPHLLLLEPRPGKPEKLSPVASSRLRCAAAAHRSSLSLGLPDTGFGPEETGPNVCCTSVAGCMLLMLTIQELIRVGLQDYQAGT